MKSLLLVVLLGTVANGWRWPWQKPTDTPEWDQLSVTWRKFSSLPMSQKDAEDGGWALSASCDVNNYFAGNRYVLKGDTATMLLFDSQGKIAGLQMEVPKSKVAVKSFPWIPEGDNYVITAYFTDPATICAGSRPSSSYLGDRLLIQTGPKPSDNMAIPFKEEDLAGSKWVKGKCFYTMGQHYWYDISADMDCKNFYPVFLLYNKDRLNGFGWNTQGTVDSPRYEHPPKSVLGYFFQPSTHPKCLDDAQGGLTTQHVYLDKRPYLNFC